MCIPGIHVRHQIIKKYQIRAKIQNLITVSWLCQQMAIPEEEVYLILLLTAKAFNLRNSLRE